MFIVIFDKSGDRSLSGWHYDKLREFDSEWIQRSVVKLSGMETAMKFGKKLLEFGVEDVRIFKANDFTSEFEDYVYT